MTYGHTIVESALIKPDKFAHLVVEKRGSLAAVPTGGAGKGGAVAGGAVAGP